MSYQQAMKAAGAQVHEFRSFGSWQGEWVAVVTYGETGIVVGSFGSCSGCDAFEAEFGYSEPSCDEHRYDQRLYCPACREAQIRHTEQLADFGSRYLDGMIPFSDRQAIAKIVGENMLTSTWDSEARSIAEFIVEQNEKADNGEYRRAYVN